MPSNFGATSTADEVLAGTNLAGKRILITGASAGLGVETARALAARGAQITGAVRDLAKGEKATAPVRAAAANGGSLELVALDLASLASIRACADALVAKGQKFDVVIANAGVMACPKSFTVDGFETQFGTNHLGHFFFVNRIISLFNPGSRLVNLASAGHRFADVDIEDPNFEHSDYTEFGAYGRSKTANILFAVEFDRRHKAAGIRATAIHPGVIQTELSRHVDPELLSTALKSAPGAPPLVWKTIPQGAATSVWSATIAPAEEIGGKYCEDCHVAELTESQARGGVRAYALDPARAAALWAKSEAMTGEKF
jgi:NAD(P)-dependent dehydrogenase (short-subunit alcohol dehydrogenase family)